MEERGIDVDGADRCRLANAVPERRGIADDEGYADGLFVEVSSVSPVSAFPKLLAVIRREDDDRLVVAVRLAEMFQQLPERIVVEADLTVVERADPIPLRSREIAAVDA